jgi:copper transporter 1
MVAHEGHDSMEEMSGMDMGSSTSSHTGMNMAFFTATNTPLYSMDVRIVSAPVKHTQPWRFSVDLPRALLMTIATAVGYLL